MEFVDGLEKAIVLLYLSGALLFSAGVPGRSDRAKRLACACAVLGFALHTLELVLQVIEGMQGLSPGQVLSGQAALSSQPFLTQGQLYFSLLGWVLLAVFFLLWWWQHTPFLALVASPLALLLFLSSMHVPPVSEARVSIPQALPGWFLGLHIGCLFLALGLLAMAFGAGIFFLRIDSAIKAKKKLYRFSRDLPSLQTFDRVNELSVQYGFPLYTVGLLSGFIWARFTWGQMISGDPKEVVSLGIWFLYAFIFHQRLSVGWRGKKAAWITIVVFLLCVISLIVVNFFLPSHHNFMVP